MIDFPIEKLKFTSTMVTGVNGNVSFEVGVKPFELSIDGCSKNIETVIRLDTINLPKDLGGLTGQSFTFPVNPDDGYIDGSIYFFAAHSPVDVTKIKFGEVANGKLPVTIETTWVLEFELTGFKNFSTTIQTYVEL